MRSNESAALRPRRLASVSLIIPIASALLALLSIKLAPRTRQFPSRRLLQRSRYAARYFARHAPPRSRKEPEQDGCDRPIIASARERIDPGTYY